MTRRKTRTAAPSNQENPSSSSGAGHPAAATNILRVGPAGWSYPDWAGYVYPSRRAKGFHGATYLAEHFHTLEINPSFCHPVPPQLAVHGIERVVDIPG